jgi:heat shock protein HtpX
MLIAVIVGAIIILCELFWRILWYSCWIGGRRHSRGGGGKGAGLMLLLALLAAIIAPILAQIIQFAASRKREYLADAGAAELTRNPNALANALEKISKHRNFYRRIEDTTKSRATQHLFIVNPLKPKGAALGFMGNLFSTHPPIQERVKILRQLAGQYVS